MSTEIEAIRAEALFVSTLQSSELPADDRVRATVASSLRRFGISGCAAQVASEFGDHPETAVVRMVWALATIRSAYRGRAAQPMAQSMAQPTALAA
jgi:hypothetical protein